MTEITHRQLRNDSAAVLRRVAAGETLVVTNHGVPAAVIGPPADDPLASLVGRGQVRRAVAGADTLRAIPRRPAPRSTAAILADVRGNR